MSLLWMLGGIIIDELFLFHRMQLEDAALHEFGIQDAAYVFLSIFSSIIGGQYSQRLLAILTHSFNG